MSTQRQNAEDSSSVDWKYKLGIIVPSWNTTMEYEAWRMAPKGVSIHISRIAHPESSEETMLRWSLAPSRSIHCYPPSEKFYRTDATLPCNLRMNLNIIKTLNLLSLTEEVDS